MSREALLAAADGPEPHRTREPDHACQSGAATEAELEAFARAHLKRAAELAYRLRIPEHVAEEILQECLIRLWRERSTVDRARWEGWLWKAIRFRRLKHFRALRYAARHQQTLVDALEPLEESTPPDVVLHLSRCGRALRDLIEALAPARRAVVRLYLLEELPMAEVAGRLGISENTAKDHWRLARIDMRAAWKRDRARERSAFHLTVFFAERREPS